MTTQPKKFWRNFTWKRFIKAAIFYFTLTLIISVIWSYFDPGDTMAENFTGASLAKRVFMSLGMGLFFSVWDEPETRNRETI